VRLKFILLRAIHTLVSTLVLPIWAIMVAMLNLAGSYRIYAARLRFGGEVQL
jgi:hypothetical protein